MKYRDIKRGYRVLDLGTTEIIGEVTSPPSEVQGGGKWAYTYTLYAYKNSVQLWSGHFFWGPVVTDLDAEAENVAPGEPSGSPLARTPVVYHDFEGRSVDEGFEWRAYPEQLPPPRVSLKLPDVDGERADEAAALAERDFWKRSE